MKIWVQGIKIILLWGICTVSVSAQGLEKIAKEGLESGQQISRNMQELVLGSLAEKSVAKTLAASVPQPGKMEVQPEIASKIQDPLAVMPQQITSIVEPVGQTVSANKKWRTRLKQVLRQHFARATSKSLTPQLPDVITPEFLSTFQARPLGKNSHKIAVSGTVFQDDTGEIYGVVTTHTIVHQDGGKGLGKKFLADVFDVNTGQYRSFICTIVQIGAPGNIDAALVLFPPQAKEVLHPGRLSTRKLSDDDVLHSQGFFERHAVSITNRQVLQQNPYLLQTSLVRGRALRRGLCGSAVFDEYGEIVGIHAGSVDSPFGPMHDISYVMPANRLAQLVHAYRSGIKSAQARSVFTIDGHDIVDLAVDEYVAEVSLFDADKNEIPLTDIQAKYSYDQIQKLIDKYEPRYIEYTVLRVGWFQDNYLLAGQPTDWAQGPQSFRYDFKTKQLQKLFTQNDPLLDALFDF